MLSMWNSINSALVTAFAILTLHKCTRSEQAEAKKPEAKKADAQKSRSQKKQKPKKAEAKEEEARIKVLLSSKGHDDRVKSVQFSSDGQMILTASHDNTVRVWNVDTWDCVQIFIKHSCGVNWAKFSLDGKKVISVDGIETMRVWDVATGECIQTLDGGGIGRSSALRLDGLRYAQLSWDDKSIVSVGRGMVGVWSVEKGEHLRYFTDLAKVISAQLSPDGRSILGASENMIFCKWFASSGKKIVQAIENREKIMCKKWKGNKNNRNDFTVSSVQFSPNGEMAVSAVDFGAVCVSDIARGEPLLELKGHSGWVRSAHFSPDGQSIVSAGSDHTVRVWNAVTGKCLLVLNGHCKVVNSAQFSPDGMNIVSASDDKTVCVWNAVTGKCVRTLAKDFDHPFLRLPSTN
jgi:WD40 repeat protein